MELAGSDLRNFEKSVGARNEVFDLSLESIELMHELRTVPGLLRRPNQLEAEQNWCQRIAEFVGRDSEKIVANPHRLAQFFDEFMGGLLGGFPGWGRLGVRPYGLWP